MPRDDWTQIATQSTVLVVLYPTSVALICSNETRYKMFLLTKPRQKWWRIALTSGQEKAQNVLLHGIHSVQPG